MIVIIPLHEGLQLNEVEWQPHINTANRLADSKVGLPKAKHIWLFSVYSTLDKLYGFSI